MDTTPNEKSLREIDEKNFESEVLRVKLPVMVAFGAVWSRPCHVLIPVLCDVTETCSDRVKVFVVNVDNNPDLGLWYGIRSIPTLVFFLNGKIQDKIVGTATKEAILNKLQSVFHSTDSAPPLPQANPEI